MNEWVLKITEGLYLNIFGKYISQFLNYIIQQ